VWANATTVLPSPLAVHAQYLKSAREVIVLEPFVNPTADLFSVLASVVVHVIYAEERWLSFSATCTNKTTISIIDLLSQKAVSLPSRFMMFGSANLTVPFGDKIVYAADGALAAAHSMFS
jgi:hypothetical protein